MGKAVWWILFVGLFGIAAYFALTGSRNVGIGTYAPTAISCTADQPDCTVAVSWVFRRQDCVSCQDFPTKLRRLRSLGVQPFNFIGVLVHDDEAPWLPEFLTKFRLRATARKMTTSEYEAAFGRDQTPTLYVTVNGCVHRVLEDGESMSLEEWQRVLSDSYPGSACVR